MSWIGLLITSTGRRYLYEPGLNFRQRLMLNILNKTKLLYLPGSLQELADKLSMFSGIKHWHFRITLLHYCGFHHQHWGFERRN